MSNDELLRDHERRLTNQEMLMNGSVKDGAKIDGVMDTLARHHRILFGDKEADTEGLVQSMQRLTNVLKYGIGALGAIQVAWMIFTQLHH